MKKLPISNIFTNIATLPGDYIYEDWNEDGIIDGNDNHPIATTSYPLLNFGINIGLQYKNFDLNMLFQGASMYYIGMSEALKTPLMWDGNALDYFMDRWHPVDPKSDPYDPSNQWVRETMPMEPIHAGTPIPNLECKMDLMYGLKTLNWDTPSQSKY